MNPRLRMALLKCRDANMPKENIERAIKKGTGARMAARAYEDLTYEIYGAARRGVARGIEHGQSQSHRGGNPQHRHQEPAGALPQPVR